MATLAQTPSHDGRLTHNPAAEADFTTLRGGAGTSVNTSNTTIGAGYLVAVGTTDKFDAMNRAAFSFDTSSIPAGATITAVTLELHCINKYYGLDPFDLCVIAFAPANPTSYAAEDYDAIADWTELAARKAWADIPADGTAFSISFNAAGLAAIQKEGTTCLLVLSSWDVDNAFGGTWRNSEYTVVEICAVDHGTAGYRPVLTVQYTTGVTVSGEIESFSDISGHATVASSSPVAAAGEIESYSYIFGHARCTGPGTVGYEIGVGFSIGGPDYVLTVGGHLTSFYGIEAVEEVTPADHGSVWRLYDVTAGAVVDAMVDCEVQDAFSRFARKATVWLFDPDGTFAAAYPRGTPFYLSCAATSAATPFRRFGGYVNDILTDDALTVLELVSFDFWTRTGPRVFEDYDGSLLLSEVLEDLITTYTPLTWAAAAVTVVNDVPVVKKIQGDHLDVVLQDLAGISDEEEWGADDDQTFFWRPRSVRRSPRDFTDGEYADAKFDEDGRIEANKVTVYWGESPTAGAVSVQDRVAQRRLQQQLGAPRPVVIEIVKVFPEITTEAAARDKAEAILIDHTVIQTGTLETWGAFDVYPGDLCRVEVEDQQIAGDYRVAKIVYRWSEESTEITLAENNEGIIDTLVELSDEVSRLDARDADADAPIVEYIRITETVGIEDELRIFTRTVPAAQHTAGRPCGYGHPVGAIGKGAWTEVLVT